MTTLGLFGGINRRRKNRLGNLVLPCATRKQKRIDSPGTITTHHDNKTEEKVCGEINRNHPKEV